MRELAEMRQRSLSPGDASQANHAISSDPLSYSQTINLNNLKSLENLAQPDAGHQQQVSYDRGNRALADFENL